MNSDVLPGYPDNDKDRSIYRRGMAAAYLEVMTGKSAQNPFSWGSSGSNHSTKMEDGYHSWIYGYGAIRRVYDEALMKICEMVTVGDVFDYTQRTIRDNLLNIPKPDKDIPNDR